MILTIMNTIYAIANIEAWKSHDFNGVWTRDLAIQVRRSNQLSYEATDVRSWSFVGSNEPVRNECEYMKSFIYRTADVKSSKLWSSQLSLHKNRIGQKQEIFRAFCDVWGSRLLTV